MILAPGLVILFPNTTPVTILHDCSMPNDGPFNTLAAQFLDSFSSNVSATQSRGLSLDPVITNNYLLLNINFKHRVVLPASTIFPNHSKCHHSNNSPSQTCQTTPKKIH